MKILVLGLGNPILGDDAIGLHIAAEVKKRISNPDVAVLQSELGGLNLLDLFIGYDKAIILDAIDMRDGKPGQIYRLNEKSFEASHHANSTHGTDFRSIIELGRKLGLDLPGQFVIFAVQVQDMFSFAEQLTPPVENSVLECAGMVLQEIEKSSADLR
jgi:hydrogenase maturation protease